MASSTFFFELTMSEYLYPPSHLAGGLQFCPFPCTNLVLNTQSENKQHQYNSNLWRSCFTACVTQRPGPSIPCTYSNSLRADPPVEVPGSHACAVPSSCLPTPRCPDCFHLKINALAFPYRLTTFLP